MVELLEKREAIARTRREVASLKLPDQFESQLRGGREDLDQIVEAAERVTSDILRAAEEIQEVAWMQRERNATKKAPDVLRFVERRIIIMIEIWGGADVSPGLPADIADTSVPSAHPDAAAGNHPPRERPDPEAPQTFKAPEALRLATLPTVKLVAVFG